MITKNAKMKLHIKRIDPDNARSYQGKSPVAALKQNVICRLSAPAVPAKCKSKSVVGPRSTIKRIKLQAKIKNL